MELMMKATRNCSGESDGNFQFLTWDRLGCFNFSVKSHAECIRYMSSFNVQLLLVGSGGYTIRSVARCWCYEIGIALGVENDDTMPPHEYYEYFGQDYTQINY